jgi:arylsulfatase A
VRGSTVRKVVLLAILVLATVPIARLHGSERLAERSNIVFIIADDLGYGDLGCYGQTRIQTPNIDRLAAEGMRFTAHYAGNNVCAPSRCVLMTGLHPGHAYIRDNRQAQGYGEGQVPVPAGYLSLPVVLKKLGYVLGGFGKWGLGPPGSSGDPLAQGFDHFFGFNCQAVAHNYYPTYLWDDGHKVALNNPAFSAHQPLPAGVDPNDPSSYTPYIGREYAPDVIGEQALKFLRENKNKPFFLYYPTTVPHLALQVPDDSLAEYAGRFPEEPYKGDRDYLPHRQPRAAYAAMITRMDREVGRLLALIGELDLDSRTIVVFTSDNGPLYNRAGGTDADFFNSAGGFRGRKGAFYEGGFRIPCIVRWKDRIEPGTNSDRVTGFEDWLPTLLELINSQNHLRAKIDGVSFAATLFGKPQKSRRFLYRESSGYGGQQCVRAGDWKALRRDLNSKPRTSSLLPGAIELYNLRDDPSETSNVASQHPDIVRRLSKLMEKQHVKSDLFPLRTLDGRPGTPSPSKNLSL